MYDDGGLRADGGGLPLFNDWDFVFAQTQFNKDKVEPGGGKEAREVTQYRPAPGIPDDIADNYIKAYYYQTKPVAWELTEIVKAGGNS